MLFLNLFNFCIKPTRYYVLQDVLWIPSSAWRKAQDLLSSSDNLAVNVMIWAIPRYRPICAILNQFCSLLSTRTSISLMLNSSSLLALDTFNKEDIFINSPFRPKKKLYLVTRHKKAHVYAHNFSVSFFSSSDNHQMSKF